MEHNKTEQNSQPNNTANASNGVNQIKFKARLIAPHFTQAPAEESEKWVKNTIAATDKAYKQCKKSIKTRKDFYQKIGDAAESGFAKYIGGTESAFKQQIMINYHANMKRAAKRYFLKRDRAYQTSKYADSIETGKKWYEESWLRYIGPLRGDKKSGIKGLGALGAMVLSADKDLVKFLKLDIDEIIEGVPICIAPPDKVGKFRNELRNLIIHLGSLIIDTGYHPETILRANEELNQLIEKYRLPEIASFSQNGDSYINFIVVEIPDSTKPGQTKKWLGLEIQVALIS